MQIKPTEEELTQRIKKEYHNQDHQMGWRFLSSPIRTLTKAKVVFLGLNPGGNKIEANQGEFSCENGNAYANEEWAGRRAGQAPLQKQVLALFEKLEVNADEVLSGNLIPFRSPDFDSLPNKKAALEFGSQLWGDILTPLSPDIIITMSSKVTISIAKILKAKLDEKINLGWGNISGTRYSYTDNTKDKKGTIIGLPHLSRFGVFNREASEEGLNKLFLNLK
jgi:hypothetical protein